MNTALSEVFVGDGVVVVRVICYAFDVGVAAVVKEDAPASYAMGCPVVDRAFLIGGWADDVGAFCLTEG